MPKRCWHHLVWGMDREQGIVAIGCAHCDYIAEVTTLSTRTWDEIEDKVEYSQSMHEMNCERAA